MLFSMHTLLRIQFFFLIFYVFLNILAEEIFPRPHFSSFHNIFCVWVFFPLFDGNSVFARERQLTVTLAPVPTNKYIIYAINWRLNRLKWNRK